MLPDHDARAAASFDLERCFVVEASAGTGKTTLIVERVLSILFEGRATIEQVAVITFTEKAAAELEERIRSTLETRISAAEEAGQVGTPDVAATARLLRAHSGLDRASIQTLHAFAASLLRRRPFEARVDPRFAVMDEEAQRALFDEEWTRWVAEQAVPDNADLRGLLVAGVELESLREVAAWFVENRDIAASAASPGTAPPDPLAHARALREWIEGGLAALRSACRAAADTLLALLVRATDQARAAERLARDEAHRALMDEKAITPIPGRRGIRKNWSGDSLRRARALALEWNAHTSAYRDAFGAWLTGQAAGWIRGFLAAYQRRKDQDGVLDFQDLLIRARDLLRTPHAARDLARTYRYVLVDEFQDTDPLQVEIVALLKGRGAGGAWHLRRPEDGSLFIVGDPKQSIYRFRRADVAIYARTRRWLEEHCGAGTVLTVSANFRSRPGITEWVNALFARLLDGQGADYAPLFACRPPSAGRAVIYLLSPAPPPPPPHAAGAASRRPTRRAEARDLEAAALARTIRSSVEQGRWRVAAKGDGSERPARYGDIAILLRAFSDVSVYEDALSEAGVSCLTSGGRRYFLRPEVAWFSALLRAVESPHDEVSVVATLRSPYFGFSDAAILAARVARGRLDPLRPGPRSDDAGRALSLLGAWHARRNADLPAAVVRGLVDESGALILAALRPGGEQRALNLLKIVDYARRHEAAGGGFRSFVRWLSLAGRERFEEGDSPVLEAGDRSVRVMTIHAAKGLEFPIVVLADLARKNRTSERFLVDRELGHMALSLKAGKHELRSTNYEALLEREKTMAREERRRLLYVASTRARDVLVLAIPVMEKEEESFLGDLLAGGALPSGGVLPSTWSGGCGGSSVSVGRDSASSESGGSVGSGGAVSSVSDGRSAGSGGMGKSGRGALSGCSGEGACVVLPNGAVVSVEMAEAVAEVRREDAPVAPGWSATPPMAAAAEGERPHAHVRSAAGDTGAGQVRGLPLAEEASWPGSAVADSPEDGLGAAGAMARWRAQRAALIERASSGARFLAMSSWSGDEAEDDLSAAEDDVSAAKDALSAEDPAVADHSAPEDDVSAAKDALSAEDPAVADHSAAKDALSAAERAESLSAAEEVLAVADEAEDISAAAVSTAENPAAGERINTDASTAENLASADRSHADLSTAEDFSAAAAGAAGRPDGDVGTRAKNDARARRLQARLEEARSRAARRARAFGLAVHAVLEAADFSELSSLAPLAAAHAAAHGCPDRTSAVEAAARRALRLPTILRARSRRVLREVPVAFTEMGVIGPGAGPERTTAPIGGGATGIGQRASAFVGSGGAPDVARAHTAGEGSAEAPERTGRAAGEGFPAIVEGRIDLLYEEDDGSLVIVDYKTDEVKTEAQARARARTYHTQLALYAEALERATRRTVREAVLLFVSPGLEIRIPREMLARRPAGSVETGASRSRSEAPRDLP